MRLPEHFRAEMSYLWSEHTPEGSLSDFLLSMTKQQRQD